MLSCSAMNFSLKFISPLKLISDFPFFESILSDLRFSLIDFALALPNSSVL
jgi:hypothetical protein